MELSTGNEIYVFPQIYNAKRSPSSSAISGNNFNLEINVVAKHAYTCGDNVVEEFHLIGTTWVYKYKSFSWDIVDRELLSSDFPYSLKIVKWDGVDKILESKDDLIQQILEFAHAVENVMPPFQDDDTVYMSPVFVKKVSVSSQEFEHIKERIIANHYENIAEILWKKVCDEIKGMGHGSSLYEEFQSLKGYVEKVVRETTNWRMCFYEDYEMVQIDALIEAAQREFRLMSAVRSIVQFLHAVHLSENKLTDECSICMRRYLPGSDAYNMPCNHNFHYGCIEIWLLKNPSFPMCRYMLPQTESK